MAKKISNERLFNVAEYFLMRAQEDGLKMTNKKLQKLVYYAQAWNLALNNKPLFENDIEAWVNGPVIPELYNKYRNYGGMPIEKKKISFKKELFTENELEILSEVYRTYGTQEADYLVWLTHTEKPWLLARGELLESEPSNNIITHKSMKDFYKELNQKYVEKKQKQQ